MRYADAQRYGGGDMKNFIIGCMTNYPGAIGVVLGIGIGAAIIAVRAAFY